MGKGDIEDMIRIAIVGCTGKLGSAIMKTAISSTEVELAYAIARKGNRFVGQKIAEIIGGTNELAIIDDIEAAENCDVYIDCTNAETFMSSSYGKYQKMRKPLIIATTAFSAEDVNKIMQLAADIPIFMSGNFSIALHDFIETVKFYARKISKDTDIQIIEYHHNQKKDAPSGTALMIKEALLNANTAINKDKVSICSVRCGNIFGDHEVFFANSKDEIVTFKHQVSSREPFSAGSVEVSKWLVKQPNGLYNMDNFC